MTGGTPYGLIFDMDGVIADTVEFHYQSWQRLADEEGVSFTRADNHALLGRTRGEALRIFLQGRILTDAEAARWQERKQQYFLEAIESFGPSDALPGVRELLEEAWNAGIPTGLASSSRNATMILERLQLTDFFSAIADGTTVANPKPAPDVFVWVAGRLNLRPAECVVFEDAEAGVRSARAGGFHVVGLGDPVRLSQAHRWRDNLLGASLAEFALPWSVAETSTFS